MIDPGSARHRDRDRVFLEAALLQHPRAQAMIEQHLTVLAIVGVVLVIGVFVLVKHLGLG